MEALAAETFRSMLKSEDMNLVQMARQGHIDHNSIVQVLKNRMAKRGLEISTISSGAGLLTKEQFLGLLGKGPLIDQGFIGASDNFNTHHGVYPHLFQMDFLMPIFEGYSLNGNIQEFFNYFGTEKGFIFWVEAFDVFGGEIAEFSQSRSLRDTYFFNNALFGHDMLNLKDPSE